MSNEPQPAIEIENVSFSYGSSKALNGLSLRVERGVIFGLLGPNGAGKTTLIRLMVGLLSPQSGTLRMLGQEPSRRMSHLVGYMPQAHSLYNELSVIQNVDFFARVYRLNDRTERVRLVEDAIRLVDLWPRRNDAVQKLSGGMKQRVSLACALVHKPPLLLLDEPTVGLDPELRVTFWRYFGGLTSQGATLVISSHTMDDAARCGQLAFMRDGKVIAVGSPADLKQATGNPQASLEEAFLFFIHRESQ